MQDHHPRQAQLFWRPGDVPVSARFDDPYYSLENGLAETEHVFLAGNGLPERLAPGFEVAELGFGTGLNLLATWRAWDRAGRPAPLRFTSFEAFPMAPDDMVRALAPFAELSAHATRLAQVWTGAEGAVTLAPGLVLNLVLGDARERLCDWDGAADAWYLDGFSPARNPELWQPDLMAEVARHTRPGGTAATYSAAGFVRRGLSDAGFEVLRVSGYGRKRHMTTARMPAP
ncbi:MAG: tRNA (5-methylaminomethyl-2-thiouridine)(34)-methyltransferase MnmD [Rhodobacteraceae bacterium]|nr:tRNA (5-methylaminomethyl-2-thiouridine)(34)-methyltransferase MnmD [Paracoccaceae bacterium]